VESSSNNSVEAKELIILLNKFRELPEYEGVKLNEVNDISAFGNTPLHIAAVQGNLKAIHLLLNMGANINACGEHGYTPLHEAIEQGNFDAAKLLIQKGSSLSIPNDDGLTAVQLAEHIGTDKLKSLFNTLKT
jgi:uncharacterized protein